MKKLIIFFIIVNFLFLNVTFGNKFILKDIFSKYILIDKEKGISIDNEIISPDVPAIEIENIVFIPIRFVAEHLHYKVSWNHDKKIVTIFKGAKKVTFKIGEQEVKVGNRKERLLDRSLIYKDRAMVPYDLVRNELPVDLNTAEAKSIEQQKKVKLRAENIFVKYLVIVCWFFCILLWLRSIFNMLVKGKQV